ncbi:MAG: DUF4124 domain-containing protein [Deltaproteobacteria bacterium]|nr:DUF4124 domain-containing protein [Deltaproteobacteria bacterium]
MKKFRLILCAFCFAILSFGFGFAGIDYKFINSKDTSYANIRRGVIRIRIKHDMIPSESELKQVSKEAWKKYRENWKTGTVFMYVKDMPANSTAYAASEFKRSRIQGFWINTQALEVHEYSKMKEAETVKQGPNVSAEIYKCIDADGQVTFTTKSGPGCKLLPGSVEKKAPPVKTPAPIPSRPAAKSVKKAKKYKFPRCTTNDGYFACLKEEWLDHVTRFITAKDYDSIDAYISSKKCLVMKGGLVVTVIDSPGMFGGKTSFIYNGIKFWTYREGVNY